ncbi:hypothetical protein CGLO_09844 [Colletotrichum gloeosporioides Cg-14]|uniref:Uncharacterized protein n=1 Tax=Colletotrichum gloeosporioides (strain Cg-14) TaxID=1237896 RepID=T0LR43_COLGC|nr:hypothetical protein CGLO_09844 [Colletotrichum gloeosporioides Cg-14]
MGAGQMTVPLFVSALPKGMTLTIAKITDNTPSNMYASFMPAYQMSIPHTFTAQEVQDAKPSSKDRGAKLGDFAFRTKDFLGCGQGASFLVKFTIKGRPDEYPEADVQDTQGQLTIGTSDWGRLFRPDQTNFTWTIGNKSQSYSAKTPTLTYLDDSCLLLSYVPDQKAYVFGVTNQQDFIVKLMQKAVGGIVVGHKALYSAAAGTVCAFGGVAVAVVAFGANYVDGN